MTFRSSTIGSGVVCDDQKPVAHIVDVLDFYPGIKDNFPNRNDFLPCGSRNQDARIFQEDLDLEQPAGLP